MTEEQIRDLADGVLRDTLGAYGYSSVKVMSTLDSDDGATLSITAELLPGSGMVRADAFAVAHDALIRTLLAHGETRFPYLRTWHPDDERADSDNRRQAS